MANSTPDFEIREACEGDSSDLSRLLTECDNRSTIKFKDTLVYVEQQDGKSVVRGFINHDRTRGAIRNKITKKYSTSIRHIFSIGVDSKHRRRGIASKLIQGLIDQTDQEFYTINVEKETPIDGVCKKLGLIVTPTDHRDIYHIYTYARVEGTA